MVTGEGGVAGVNGGGGGGGGGGTAGGTAGGGGLTWLCDMVADGGVGCDVVGGGRSCPKIGLVTDRTAVSTMRRICGCKKLRLVLG